MYNNSAYLNQTRLAIIDKSKDLIVTSCGRYKLLTKTKLPTIRPNGRPDFQIIYVASGKGYFYIDHEKTLVTAGNLVIYYPKERQEYYYYLRDNPSIYWVHFTGKNVRNILRKYNIEKKQHIVHIGTDIEVSLIFKKMIQELLLLKEGYDEMLSYLLRQLLILSKRDSQKDFNGKNNKIYSLIDSSIEYFNKHYSEEINIKGYAESIGCSPCWFIRKFKESIGTTPMQYILDTRIKTAEQLLINTDYNISEISDLIGYNNPLYFSRHFKQKMGLSPKEYRKKVTQ